MTEIAWCKNNRLDPSVVPRKGNVYWSVCAWIGLGKNDCFLICVYQSVSRFDADWCMDCKLLGVEELPLMSDSLEKAKLRAASIAFEYSKERMEVSEAICAMVMDK